MLTISYSFSLDINTSILVYALTDFFSKIYVCNTNPRIFMLYCLRIHLDSFCITGILPKYLY